MSCFYIHCVFILALFMLVIIAHSWGRLWFFFFLHTPYLTHYQFLSIRPSYSIHHHTLAQPTIMIYLEYHSPLSLYIFPIDNCVHSYNSYASKELNMKIPINCPKPSNGFLKYMGVQFKILIEAYMALHNLVLAIQSPSLHLLPLSSLFSMVQLHRIPWHSSKYVKHVSGPKHLYEPFFLPGMFFLHIPSCT